MAEPSGDRTRDHLANERTLLSWVRLGIATSGFGFVVSRFGLFLRIAAGQAVRHSSGRWSEWIGVALVLLGPTLVGIAVARFFRTEKAIDEGRYLKQYGLIGLVVAISVLLGLVLAAYLIYSSG